MATTKALSMSFDMKQFYSIDSSGNIDKAVTITSKTALLSSVGGVLTLKETSSNPTGTVRTLVVEEVVNGSTAINNLWKVTYHEQTDTIYIVGVTDVFGLSKPRKYTYPLDGSSQLFIKRVGPNLVITYVK